MHLPGNDSPSLFGQIVLSLEVCKSNSNVYGTVTMAVIIIDSNGASHLQDNNLVLAVRRNQRLDDFPSGQLWLALAS
jgi:hypothetical protein